MIKTFDVFTLKIFSTWFDTFRRPTGFWRSFTWVISVACLPLLMAISSEVGETLGSSEVPLPSSDSPSDPIRGCSCTTPIINREVSQELLSQFFAIKTFINYYKLSNFGGMSNKSLKMYLCWNVWIQDSQACCVLFKRWRVWVRNLWICLDNASGEWEWPKRKLSHHSSSVLHQLFHLSRFFLSKFMFERKYLKCLDNPDCLW